MNREPQRCASPSIYGEGRCTNMTYPGCKHCAEHKNTAKKSYDRYKRYHSRAEDYNHTAVLASDDANEILKYHALLTKAHAGRLNHRLSSFAPETRDRGHKIQIRNLKNKIADVENKLEKLFHSEPPKLESVYISDEEIPDDPPGFHDDSPQVSNQVTPQVCDRNTPHPSNHNTPQVSNQITSQFCARNTQQVSVETLEKQQCVIEMPSNSETRDLRDMTILEDKVLEFIRGATSSIVVEVDISVMFVCIMNIIMKCDALGYFRVDYAPDDAVTDVRSFSNTLTPLVQRHGITCAPGCIREVQYRKLYSVDTLKLVYTHMLLNRSKVLGLVSDLIDYSLHYRDAYIFTQPFKLLWCSLTERMLVTMYVRPGQNMMRTLRNISRLEERASIGRKDSKSSISVLMPFGLAYVVKKNNFHLT
jgi:hypothetical protein